MLRADIFPERWDVVPLGEAVTFLDNMRRPVTASERVAGPYPYYGANGIQGTIDGFIFDEPLLLLAEDGGNFGNPDRDIAYIAEGRYWVNNHAHVIRPKASLDLRFLYRVLQRYDVTPFIKGATRAKLTKGDASLIPIPLPPLPEQKRIAAILDKADAIRRKRQQAIQLADDFLRAVFLDMFGDPVTNPKGWEVKLLKDLSLKIHSGNTPKGGKENYVESGVVFLRSQNVWKRKIILDDVAYIDSATHKKMAGSSLRNQDILMTKTGRFNTENSSLGRAAMFCGEDDSANVNGHVYLIRLGEKVDKKFVLFILTMSEYYEYIRSVCVGGIDKRQLNKEHLENFPIIFPSADMQRKFSEVMGVVDKAKTQAANSLQSAEMMFDALSQKAFSGQL